MITKLYNKVLMFALALSILSTGIVALHVIDVQAEALETVRQHKQLASQVPQNALEEMPTPEQAKYRAAMKHQAKTMKAAASKAIPPKPQRKPPVKV